MKLNEITIKRAAAAGMCFGVKDALARAEKLAGQKSITVLGPLVHNPLVQEKLARLGVSQVDLSDAVEFDATKDYLISAHGVSEHQRQAWQEKGLRLHDSTCPLVHRAHQQLRQLVQKGFHPVVIGQASHVEVQGLIGDYSYSTVVLESGDLAGLPQDCPLGIVAQTTQPIRRVLELVLEIRRLRPGQPVEFVDTVCQPTKQRQEALRQLCREVELVVIVGGRHSNNTRQLLETAISSGCRAIQVESARDLRAAWFENVGKVGLSAGTSTLDETIDEVERGILAFSLQSTGKDSFHE